MNGVIVVRCLMLIGCLSSILAQFAKSGDYLENRFIKEAPQQWLEYRKIVTRHTEGSYKYTVTNPLDHDKLASATEISFILDLDHNCFRVMSKDNNYYQDSQSEDCEVTNPKYSFMVKPGAGNNWTIDRLLKRAPRHISSDLIGRRRPGSLMGDATTFGDVIGMACQGQTLWAGWLPLMVASPEFKLIRATDLKKDGQFIKIEYTYEPKSPTGGAAPSRSGILVLDSTRYWLIRDAETEASYSFGKGSLNIKNEFEDFEDSGVKVPYVSHEVMNVSAPKGPGGKPWHNVYIWDINLHKEMVFDEKLFTLTSFGLPEPHLMTPSERSGTGLMFYCIWGAFIALILILASRHFRKRGQTEKNW